MAVRHSMLTELHMLIDAGANLNGVGPMGEPFWAYALADNTGASRLSSDDDALLEWVVLAPDLRVNLSDVGAAAAIGQALRYPAVAAYAAYLQARGNREPSLSAGTLVGSYAGSELRLYSGRLRKNGLDITPPGFNLSGRPLFIIGDHYHFVIDTAALPSGVARDPASPPDYGRRFVYYDAPTFSWKTASEYINIHGMEQVSLTEYYYGVIVMGLIPGQGSYRGSASCFVYGCPYRP